MASIGVLVRRWPRVAAAVSFGAVGSFFPATWFLPSVLSRRDGVAFILFIVLPGLASAVSGALAGIALCDPARNISQGNAALRGAVVATLALLIFAPTFAVFFTLTAPGQTNVLAMTILVLQFSLLTIWWIAAPVGGAVGWLLHHIASGQDLS